jgi:hypothetical protein
MVFFMTQLLDQAFQELAKLPPSEQDALASALLAEIRSEKRWTAQFQHSQNLLDKLADEALAEHRSGKTESP